LDPNHVIWQSGVTITAIAAGGSIAAGGASGASDSLVLRSDGAIATWGDNSQGQLGNGTTTSSSVPVAVADPNGVISGLGKKVVAVAAGADHNIALCSDGTMAAWGSNDSGQLGNNSSAMPSSVPVSVSSSNLNLGENFAAVSSGPNAAITQAIVGTLSSGWPPFVTAVSLGAVADNAALNGIVDGRGQPTTYYFQFGPTSSYGQVTTTASLPSPYTGTAVSTPNLPPGFYHFRLVANSNGGTTTGPDQTAVIGATWTKLQQNAPKPVGLLLLLSNGTVMASNSSSNADPETGWSLLTPDAHGSYVNGTWSTLSPMHDKRDVFSSAVLQSGQVFVAGGEYGGTNANGTVASAETYNPQTDSWTYVNPPTALLDPNGTIFINNKTLPQAFVDSICKIQAQGKVLIAPVLPNILGATLLFDPASSTWAQGPTTLYNQPYYQDEVSWVKLSDESILTVDGNSNTSERYIPATNTWVNDALVPIALWDSNIEIGPAFLLPNGKAIYFGSTGHTAIYTPSGSTTPGTWVAGPDFPGGIGMADAPGAMMVNGRILCATGSYGNAPTTYYEFDYATNSFARVPYLLGFSDRFDTEGLYMLDLPDGSVLHSNGTTTLYTYKPGDAPLAAGKPAIATISPNQDGTLHLTGTLFNGISEGAAYGDDAQMDTNYPLVRFTDAGGTVRYGRTYNWNSTGVMTGSQVVTTECAMPPGASATDTIEVVVNGIASNPANPSTVVSTANDNGFGSLRHALRFQTTPAITFDPSLSGQTIAMASGISVSSSSVIVDAGNLPGGVTLSGAGGFGLFAIASGANVTLKDLSIINGGSVNYSGNGGAIDNSGTLTLVRCTLSGNSTDTSHSGGAIFTELFSTLALTQCTLSGNSAGSGAAIYSGGAVSVTQCTLAKNTASISGGAIFNSNIASLTLINSIVAGNSAASGADIFNGGAVTATGCLIGNSANSGITAAGGNILNIGAQLAPLGAYGGPTQTMALLTGSPARNAASVLTPALTADQRGFPIVGAPDIGAYEAGTFTNYNAWIYEMLPASTAQNAAVHASSADYDGDGVTNGNEWLALTDPGNPASVLRVSQITRSGNNLSVSYPTVVGRNYTVETSPDLVVWTPAGAPIAGTGNIITTTIGPVNSFTKLFVHVRAGP
jgi:hypothetical protein